MKLPAELSDKTAVEDDDVPPWTSVSFACGGWLQFYMFGVAKALQESGLDYPSKVTYCGCSAGALAAVGLALEGNFDSAVTYCKEKCVPEVSEDMMISECGYLVMFVSHTI
jgi:predicted acylesterase/phospholipase RssA